MVKRATVWLVVLVVVLVLVVVVVNVVPVSLEAALL